MLWRYRAGKPGSNLVIVYERKPGGVIWLEHWPHGRRKRSPLHDALKLPKPVLDQKTAMKIADKMAASIETATRKDNARAILGLPDLHTLKELLDTYHAKRGTRWKTNKRHQEIARDFWLARLGQDTEVRSVAGMASDIETFAAHAAEVNGWKPRTEGKYLKYLRTAFAFGQKKLKWFGEDHNLSALEIPPADSVGRSYSTEEVRLLLKAAPKVDLRCAVAAHIAYKGLRRISAIRTLKAEDVERDGDSVALRFARIRDKAKRSGEARIADSVALSLLERLLQTPAVKATGWLFPEGDLMDRTKGRKPISYEDLHQMMMDTETKACVPHVKGRAWHGFKRRAATDSESEGMLGVAARQAGTNEKTLRDIYVQHDPEPKTKLAKTLAKRVGRK